MSVTNPNKVATKQDLADFYQGIRPYLGGTGNMLSRMSDTSITSPTDGQVLTYDATNQVWKNADGSAEISELGDIADVDLTNLQNGQTIVWDATNSKWINSSGGGGTSDYSDLTNKPSINSVTLSGNKSLTDLGIVTESKTAASGGTTLSLVTTGEKYNSNTNTPWYATCSTAASTASKTASLSRGSFTLISGAKAYVKFTYTNTASAPTLAVGGTTAKNIKYVNTSGTVATPTTWWKAGDVVAFIYDGTQYLMQPTLSMGGGASYTAGTGIDMTNNVIGVKEFESTDMSEVVSPLPSSASKYMNYSTEEQVVGQWLDGKTIYQKSFQITMPTCSTNGTGVAGRTSIGASVDRMISLSTTVRNGNFDYVLEQYLPTPLVSSSKPIKPSIQVRINSDTSYPNNIEITNYGTAFNSQIIYVTLQYTKVS